MAAIAALAGAGPFAVLVPTRWRNGWTALPLLLNLGMGLIALVAVNVIAANGTIGLVAPVAIAVSVALLAFKIIVKRSVALAAGLALLRDIRIAAPSAALMLAAALVALWPSLRLGGDQPYRVGVDQLGYAVSAQFLLDGGTPSSLAATIMRETGQPTLAEALPANVTSLDFPSNIASEFILRSHRSGYPGLAAVMLRFAGVERALSAQCLVLLFPVWLLISVAAVFLREDLGFSRPSSLIWAVAWGSIATCSMCSGRASIPRYSPLPSPRSSSSCG